VAQVTKTYVAKAERRVEAMYHAWPAPTTMRFRVSSLIYNNGSSQRVTGKKHLRGCTALEDSLATATKPVMGIFLPPTAGQGCAGLVDLQQG
jgi:hypothetical protein